MVESNLFVFKRFSKEKETVNIIMSGVLIC